MTPAESEPTIIKPFFGDQSFWAERVESLNVGSAIRKLTVEHLAEALHRATTDEKQIAKARVVGEVIRKENGVATAIEAIYRDLVRLLRYFFALRCFLAHCIANPQEYAKSLIKPLARPATPEPGVPLSTLDRVTSLLPTRSHNRSISSLGAQTSSDLHLASRVRSGSASRAPPSSFKAPETSRRTSAPSDAEHDGSNDSEGSWSVVSGD